MTQPPAVTPRRDFSCDSCGANLTFKPGTDSLSCPYCGGQTAIDAGGESVQEQDLRSALAALEAEGDEPQISLSASSVQCTQCGAEVALGARLTAARCAFCDAPVVVREEGLRLIAPKGLLPFGLDAPEARARFRQWVRSRWFAPNDLKRVAETDGLNGVYVPFWTFDTDTLTEYRGQRGTHYWTGYGRRRRRRTRWASTSGTVSLIVDDELVLGSTSLPENLAAELEPWDLEALVPFDEAYVAGFLAERYHVDLREAFEVALPVIKAKIRAAVERDIGGDEQRIISMRTAHREVTYKHVLLPVWISAFRFRDRLYRLLVNARTGEVQGERPWSVVKLVLTAIAIAVVVYVFRDPLGTFLRWVFILVGIFL